MGGSVHPASLTPKEQAFCEGRHTPIHAYARYYAIKEAAVKALGTGFTQGVGWRSVEVVRRPKQKPTLAFHGAAQTRLQAMTPMGWQAGWDMSVSDEPPYATAVVILYAVQGGNTLRDTPKDPIAPAQDS